MLSISFDRTSLSLGDLTLPDYPAGDFWLPDHGVEWPRFGRRKDYAPSSRYLSGRTLLARVTDIGTLPLSVYVGASTTANLDALKAELQAAVDQWSYDLTVTVDGVTATYTAECVDDDISWGEIDNGFVRSFIARGTFAVPLYP